MTQRIRLIALISAAVVVLLGAGVFVTVRMLASSVDNAIPQADLFGTPTPSTTLAKPTPTPSPTPTVIPGSDIKGPLNFLLIGEDTREGANGQPHNDTNLILHINADLTKAYLVSLPRDLLVSIPAFAPAGFGGNSRTKLTHAMAFGSKVPGGWDTKQGFQLVFQTISNYTGIEKFDGGVLFSFIGMREFVDAIGGIDMYVDYLTKSIHVQPNAWGRTPCRSCEHGVTGPQMTYNVGMTHMNGWQSLDFARQRYGLPQGAYSRERHHRQIVRAVMAQLFKADLVLNPVKIKQVLDAMGRGVIFDGRGRQPSEYGYALRNLKPADVTLIGLPGSSVGGASGYAGESLHEGPKDAYFAALVNDKLDAWVAGNPSLINTADP